MTLVGAFGIALTFTSCVNPYYAGPNEQNGAVAGAVGGGLLGAIIGNQSGRPLEGAAIGGLLGSFAGSRIGASRDMRYAGWNPGYNSRFYSVRSRPVYSSRYTPYRYSPYRYSYTPYRYNYSPFSLGYSPFVGGSFGSGAFLSGVSSPVYGFGRGWGYGPSCW